VAEEAGIFEDVGVNVELVWFEGYLDSINAFAAGQLDGNTQTLNDTIASVGAGSDQVIVLTNDNSTGNDQIIVTEDIQSIEDLAGTTIGVEVGVVDHFLLLLGLESAGMTADDLEIVNLETGAAAAAFASGQMDGVGVFAPFTTQALLREGAHPLFTSADFPGAIPDHLAVSRELIDERPEDVQKLIEAWFLTLEWMEENRDEALETMAERAGVSVEDYVSYEAGTTLFSVEDNLQAFEEGSDFTSLHFVAAELATFLVEAEFVESEPDVSTIFDASFIQAYADAQ
jgi:NitT/TauT family transport system substrate-binding protein